MLDIQAHADGVGIAMTQRTLWSIHRQGHLRAGQLLLPHAQLFAQRFAAAIGLQARGPIAQRAGLGRQADGLAVAQLAVDRLQILQQHAPRHAVHHQVMDRDQQALLTLRAIHQQGAQQRAVLKVKAALGVGEQRGAVLHIAHLRLHQHAALRYGQVLGMPLGVASGEAQAQGIVVFQHRQQRLLQAMRLEQLQRFKHQRLVPVLTIRAIGLEEPMLDRRKARAASEHTLFSRDLLGAGRNGRQGVHGLVLEQVARREMNPGLARTADHLDRQDRVAAQLKEVIVQADLRHVQHGAPDSRQGLLPLVARRDVLLAVGFGVRLRQGAAVELAVRGQRHAVQHNQVRGHHVVRQLRLEVCLQRVTQCAGVCVADQIGHQLLATGRIQRQHHRFAHRCVFQQTGFDFTQFDAETTNFHLMVDPTQVFHQAIGALAYQVARAVQTAAMPRERVGDKTLGRHARTLVITLGQTGAANIQLAGRTLRYQGQVGVENVGHAGADDAADRHTGSALLQVLRRQTGQRHHHGFGRAIGVEKHRRLERCADTLQVLAGQRFATGDAHAHRQRLVLGGQPLRQLAAVTRGKTQHVDAMGADQRTDFFGIPLPLGAQHHLRTTEQRHQQTFGGGVEVDRIKVQLAVVRAHAEARDHGLAMHGDFTMGDHHAFGLAGGAGGVDQVGRMLRHAEKRQRVGRVIGQHRQVIFQAPASHAHRQFAEGLEHRCITEQQPDTTVFDHVVQAVQRVFRVERHIGTARLEDRQQPDDHFQRTRQRQADAHLRADATLAQHPREAIGAAVQFAVIEGFPGEGQGSGIGTGCCLLAEQ